MSSARPHYLLYSESAHDSSTRAVGDGVECGRWRFVLKEVEGTEQIEVADEEPGLLPDRLELLAVVRGLEALPGPSRVTLITNSRYVNRGIRFGLAEWRENGWQWEHFGEMSTVTNADLWQRLDSALHIHCVQCRSLRFDRPHHQEDRLTARHALRVRTGGRAVSKIGREYAERARQLVGGWFGRRSIHAAQLLQA